MSTTMTDHVSTVGKYDEPFSGRKKFLLAVKNDPIGGTPYFTSVTIGGLQFIRVRQRPYAHSEEDGVWLRLSQPGAFGWVRALTHEQVRQFVEKVNNHVVRPTYDPKVEHTLLSDGRRVGRLVRARRLSLDVVCRHKDVNGVQHENQVGVSYNEGDIPIAHCLILIPWSELQKYGPRGPNLPSVAEIQPSTAEIAESLKTRALADRDFAEDELWAEDEGVESEVVAATRDPREPDKITETTIDDDDVDIDEDDDE